MIIAKDDDIVIMVEGVVFAKCIDLYRPLNVFSLVSMFPLGLSQSNKQNSRIFTKNFL